VTPRNPAGQTSGVRHAPDADFFLDTASFVEVVRALSGSARASEIRPWAWGTARSVTSLLLFSPTLLLPKPSSGIESEDRCYSALREGLAEEVKSYVPQDNREARARARRWASTRRLQQVLDETQEHDEYREWEDWSVGFWPTHSARNRGLFDDRFIVPVARVLNVTEKYAVDLHHWTQDQQVVDNLIRVYRSGNRTPVLEEVRIGWLVSSLVRARYYDSMADAANLQVSHHPFRQFVFGDNDHTHTDPYVTDPFERCLANIVLAGALTERRPERRVGLFVSNVRSVREARLAGALRVPSVEPIDPGIALANAADEAARFGVVAHSRLLEFGLDIALSASLTATLWFTPHASEIVPPVAGLGAEAVLARSHAAKAVTRRLKSNPRHLKKLAKAGPGRAEFQPAKSP
jgi:hypothetical protein